MITTLVKTTRKNVFNSNQEMGREFLKSLFPRGITKVLFLVPPDSNKEIFNFSTAKRGRYPNYPPYGLMVLAQNVRTLNIKTELLDLNNEILKAVKNTASEDNFDFDGTWKKIIEEKISYFEPDLVIITCMFTMTHESFKRLAKVTSEMGKIVAAGGVHVSNDADRILDDVPEISFVFTNEGDKSLKVFINSVNDAALPQTQIGQVIFNDPSKKLIQTENGRIYFLKQLQPSSEEINVLPAYDLINLKEYAANGTVGAFYCFKPEDTVFATVLSNRGCRAQCTFCSVRNFNGQGVRQRSVNNVVDELDYLVNEKGVGHVMWLDDDLFKEEARWIEICNAIIKRNLKFTWDATNGLIASSINFEIMEASSESGCIAVNIGMESGNKEILRTVKKPGTVQTFLRAAEVLKKFETIHSSVFLMIGFPGETLKMIYDTISVAIEMDLDWYRISQLQPLPNTPIYDSMVEQGLITRVGDGELRFMGGGYGKQTEIEQGLRQATKNFVDAFSSIGLDQIPTGDQLTEIWFYMNYHLNFHRIFYERRDEKIKQLMAHLKVLGDVISPENAFSLYFLGYLQYKKFGQIEKSVKKRLSDRVQTSPYWADRFSAFNLRVNDLSTLNFENESIPPQSIIHLS
jgi:radical SAM superfamily enzyme YgiQ (UPF0313 family)